MWETFVQFLITWISLWLVSKVLGKGLIATADGLFLTAALNTLFGAIAFSATAYLPMPPLARAVILISATLFFLPVFSFWFADRFVGGFKLKTRKYFVPACLWFLLITFAGTALINMLPFIGLGLFGLGSRYAGDRAHPGWFYPRQDYWYFYG